MPPWCVHCNAAPLPPSYYGSETKMSFFLWNVQNSELDTFFPAAALLPPHRWRNCVKLCYVSHVYVSTSLILHYSFSRYYLSLSFPLFLSLVSDRFFSYSFTYPQRHAELFFYDFKMQFQFVSRSILLHTKEKQK